MTSVEVAILLSLAVALLALQVFTRKQKQQQNKKKKKRFHPVAGTVFNHLLNFHRLHHYMTDLARKYNTYRVISLFHTEIYTSDPVNVEHILKTNFGNYGKGMYNYRILKDLLGDGIFTVDGDKWRDQRKLSSYELSTKVLRDFSSNIFRQNAAKVATLISRAATSNKSIDIQELFMKSTMDSIFKVGFGVELDSMSGSSDGGSKFSKALDDSNAITHWRFVDISWRIKRFLNIGLEAKLKKNIEVVDDFVYKLIHNKMRQMQDSQDDSIIKKEDILSRLLMQGRDTDPKYLRDIILSFVIAGRDTTAVTLSWFIYVLCKNPDIQEKICQEIKEATGGGIISETKNIAEFAAAVDQESLEKMQYLHAALTETLRLYPGLPVDTRICFSDDTLPDGFSVRKGDVVAYQPYAMGRMKVLWGDDAEEFRPERWFDDKGIFQPESPFKFTAFQAGPRTCLGKEFAYRQMKIFSAVLLALFEFKLSDQEKAVNYRTMIILQIDGGLHVRAFNRSSASSIS